MNSEQTTENPSFAAVEAAPLEPVRQELAKRESFFLARLAEADDFHVGREFVHELPAHAAGDARAFGFSGDDDADEMFFSFADGVGGGGAFSASADRIGCIFDIAAGIDRAIVALERGAHWEMRIGAIGLVKHGDSQTFQFFQFHHSTFRRGNAPQI